MPSTIFQVVAVSIAVYGYLLSLRKVDLRKSSLGPLTSSERNILLFWFIVLPCAVGSWLSAIGWCFKLLADFVIIGCSWAKNHSANRKHRLTDQ